GAPPEERSVEDEGRRAVARRAAAASIVLLHDARGLLPLDLGRVRRVAVIGPNADRPATQGGGSAQVNPHRSTTPAEALITRPRPARPGGPRAGLPGRPGCRGARPPPPGPGSGRSRRQGAGARAGLRGRR